MPRLRDLPPLPPAADTPAQERTRSALTDYDLYLFRQGSHQRLYEKLGAHVVRDAEPTTGPG